MPMQDPNELETITTCSSITQLPDATDLDNSFMLVSQPDWNWETYSSRKAPLSVIGKTIISSSSEKIRILSSGFDTLSTLLSDALEQDGKSICVNVNVGSPYIISSIYEKHGAILSIDGYSLSDQIQVSAIHTSSEQDIAYLSIGNAVHTIAIPLKEQDPTAHICAFSSPDPDSVIKSQSRDVVLTMNVMSQSTYDTLWSNTSVDYQRQPSAIDQNNPYVHPFELYLTTEDEIEPDPTVNASLLATEGTPSSHDDQGESDSDGEQTQEQDQESEDGQPESDQVDEMVGRDIHDFDDVTFLDVQAFEKPSDQNDEPESNPNEQQETTTGPQGNPEDGEQGENQGGTESVDGE